jgi:hypothetical protein
MTKKSRRTRAKHQVRTTGAAGVRRAEQPRAVAAEPQSPARGFYRAQDPASRYQHVIPEVKRIGIIAGAIVLVLIILAFILG